MSVEIRASHGPAFDETQPLASLAPRVGDWRAAHEATRRRTHLRGAGLALFGLRRLPVVGRNAERDALWGALQAVNEEGRRGAVVLSGPSGAGKSRLAEWLCERAHELGIASVLKISHSPGSGGARALGETMRGALCCGGLDRQGMLDRVERLLRARVLPPPEDEALALVELMSPATRAQRLADPGIPRIDRPEERYALVERHLDQLLATRPVILWLDDVQWGLDALHFAEHLLRPHGWDRPLLLVLTARDDLLAEQPIHGLVLAGLLAAPHVDLVRLDPLDGPHRKDLIRQLLGLDSVLAARLEERTAGNPLFAVQLIGDWVQRGILVPGRLGFELAEHAAVDLPDDLHALWSDRVDRLLSLRPAADGIALELMAALGQDVAGTDWEAVCFCAGITPSRGLVSALVAHRLARWREGTGGSWSLVHGMLRESLARRAEDSGRDASHHRLCAELLAERHGPGMAERIARHWMRAGAASLALGPLRRACEERDRAGDGAGAAVLAEEYARCLTAAPEVAVVEDHLWVRWRAVARARTDGEFEHGLRLADSLIADARAARARGVLIDGLRERGHLLEHLTRLDDALVSHREAAALAAEDSDGQRLAVITWLLATALWKRGDLADAQRQAEHSIRLSEGADLRFGVVRARSLLATIVRQRGDLDGAVRLALVALAEAERLGYRSVAASAHNVVGEVERLRGNSGAAVTAYRKAVAIHRSLGSRFGLAPALNLGVVLIELGRFAEAREQLDEVLRRSRRLQMAGSTLGALISLLPCDAAQGEWTSWDRHLEEARLLMERTGFIEDDCPRFLRFAAELAIAEGHHGRARTALRVAGELWVALGQPDQAKEIDTLVAALP